MIKPSRPDTYITLGGYPMFAIYVSLVQCIGRRCTLSSFKSRSIQIIPVGLASDPFFIAHPADIRTDITKHDGIRCVFSHGVFKTPKIILLLFSIWTFTIGAVPPKFKERTVTIDEFLHRVYVYIIVFSRAILRMVAIPGRKINAKL